MKTAADNISGCIMSLAVPEAPVSKFKENAALTSVTLTGQMGIIMASVT